MPTLSKVLISLFSFPVFFILDLLDFFLGFFFRLADAILERETKEVGEEEFHSLGLSSSSKKKRKKKGSFPSPRWSDCSCKECVSWIGLGEERLHFVIKEPGHANQMPGKSPENVIFLHGFLSSSSLWAELVFPNISQEASDNIRLFAVDLLGFGKSPKPGDCLYTLKDHVEMIEKTLINHFKLDSFHLVSHSMGCIIALAIAEKYPGRVKSLALAAPPYFSAEEPCRSLLKRVVPRKIWPPLSFGAAVMSWYKHLGRSVCFFICRFHILWDQIVMVLTRRDLHFTAVDLTKHTHHSAWHTMHNVICDEGMSVDRFLEALSQSGVPVLMVHGSDDQIVPIDGSHQMKHRVPHIDFRIIPGVDHSSIIWGREVEFTADLETLWFSSVVTEENIPL